MDEDKGRDERIGRQGATGVLEDWLRQPLPEPMIKPEPPIKTPTCEWLEVEARFWLMPEHFQRYRLILAAIEDIAGPADGLGTRNGWAFFDTIAYRLSRQMGRTMLRERLMEMVEAGVVDRVKVHGNRAHDYLPRYTHILRKIEEGHAR